MSTAPLPDRSRAMGAMTQSVALAFRFLFLAVCAIAVFWSVSNVRRIPPDSQALVTRFGAVVREQGPGLLLAWPSPVEEVFVLPSSARQMEFRIARFDTNAAYQEGGQSTDAGYASFDLDPDPRNNTGFLLTGDSSVVHLQAVVFYQITDPVAYVISSQHVLPALERLFIASAVSVCAGRDLDSILVARPESALRTNDASLRERLRADILNAVNRRLEALAVQGSGLGIQVSRVDLAAAIPTGAKAAFDKVLTVTQNAETDIAVARTSAQLTSQDADRQKDRIVTDATASAEEQVTGAQTQTASIAALAHDAQGPSRDMLLNRVYFERAGNLLSKAGRLDAVDPEGKVHVILPGESR
ncbi:MAG TPA: SPFH domain-containing protein [Rhizomicrobium sp.]|nr:SPFH domain-containing protein [Rhizomicrobium sp.]